MHMKRLFFAAAGACVLLSACANAPTRPTVDVLPSPTKPFQAFEQDDAACREFALDRHSRGVRVANNEAVAADAPTTGLSTLGRGEDTGVGRQLSYDMSYSQCMYARGNRVLCGSRQPWRWPIPQCTYARGNKVPDFARPHPRLPPPPLG